VNVPMTTARGWRRRFRVRAPVLTAAIVPIAVRVDPTAVLLVNGHEVLPSGGHEISPYAVMSSAPPAAMRIPHSRESGWI